MTTGLLDRVDELHGAPLGLLDQAGDRAPGRWLPIVGRRVGE